MNPTTNPIAATAETKRKLRLWPAVLIMAIFWIFQFGCDYLEFSMSSRFMTRFAFYGVVVLCFLAWWLFFSRAKWQDRLLVLVVMIASGLAAGVLADKKSFGSMGPVGLIFAGFPFVLTLWTAWLLITSKWLTNLSPMAVRVGLCCLIVMTWGFFDLVRWDGLDGGQHAAFSLRWTATPEEQFLLQREKAKPAEVAPVAQSIQLQPGDWPEFRGPQRNSQVRGQNLATDWNAHPPKQIWRHRVGPGWSSVIIVDGRLFTQEQRGEQENIVCYDAATGMELWAHSDATRFDEPLSQAGPRGTPTFADGKIYALGATGRLNCLNAATGELVWTHDIVADADAAPAPTGMPIRQWGYANSPLVARGMVIVFAGGLHDKNVLAYDAATGLPKWNAVAGKDGYSSPQLADVEGKAQLLIHSNAGLRALGLETGESLWDQPSASAMFVPITQPQSLGDDQLLAQSSEGVQLVKLTRENDKWSATRNWESTALKPSLNDYVVHDGSIYGFDDGVFCCLDLATGKRRWKAGRFGHGQELLIEDQGLLLVMSETGEAILVAANPKKLEELSRFQAIEGKTWNHPVIVHGRLFVRNGEEMACYELPMAEQPASK